MRSRSPRPQQLAFDLNTPHPKAGRDARGQSSGRLRDHHLLRLGAMIYLSAADTPLLREAAGRGYRVGLMSTPENGVARYSAHYGAWAGDNGCYSLGHRFNLDRFLSWLDRQDRATCLFAAAPDVVGDAGATWARSAPVLPVLRGLGFRAALVAQDGWGDADVDWDSFDTLFVGGTTAFKLAETTYALAREAKARGKWIHMGRVNSWPRIRMAALGGYDSVDGSGIAINPGKNLARVLRWLDRLALQRAFPV